MVGALKRIERLEYDGFKGRVGVDRGGVFLVCLMCFLFENQTFCLLLTYVLICS